MTNVLAECFPFSVLYCYLGNSAVRVVQLSRDIMYIQLDKHCCYSLGRRPFLKPFCVLCIGDMNIVLIISHTCGIIHHENGCWQLWKRTLNIRHNPLYSGSKQCNKHQKKVSLHSTMKSWNGQFDCVPVNYY